MQRVENYEAEDSSLKDQFFGEKNGEDHSGIALNATSGDHGVAKDLSPLEKNSHGIAEPRAPDSDPSIIIDDDEEDDFPEGGLRAWLVVLGSFCGSFSVFGIINSTAVLLDYFSAHQLKEYNASEIGWIFG
jgi:hypothetical protein